MAELASGPYIRGRPNRHGRAGAKRPPRRRVPLPPGWPLVTPPLRSTLSAAEAGAPAHVVLPAGARDRRRRVAAVVFALLAPGCGGGGGDGPTDPPPAPPPPSAPPRVQATASGLATGGSVQLVASVVSASGQPASGYTIWWQSLDTTVATVTERGRASGVRPGVARLVAGSTGAFPDTIAVTVAARVTATAVQAGSRILTGVGDTVRLAARSQAGAAEHVGAYTWSARDAAIATVDGTGVVTGRGLGSTWIVVREAAGSTDSAQVRVADVRLTSWTGSELTSAPIFAPAQPLLRISEPIDRDLVVRLVSADTRIAAPVADALVIARGDTTVRAEIRVGMLGTTTVEVRAAAAAPTTLTITSAEPRIKHQNMSALPGEYRLAVGAEIQLLASFVTTADPPHIIAHNLLEERVITAVSTDTTVVRIVRGTLRIPAGEAFVPFGEWGIARAVGPGTAYVRLTAPGALPDSLLPMVVQP